LFGQALERLAAKVNAVETEAADGVGFDGRAIFAVAEERRHAVVAFPMRVGAEVSSRPRSPLISRALRVDW
jgi:hypothetical protein